MNARRIDSYTACLILWMASCPAIFGATLTVTNLADNGPGTLRDSIADSVNGDRINFGVSGTVVLQSQLTISSNIRIDGINADLSRISGNNATRIFNITAPGTVQINNLTLSDGRVVGTNG